MSDCVFGRRRGSKRLGAGGLRVPFPRARKECTLWNGRWGQQLPLGVEHHVTYPRELLPLQKNINIYQNKQKAPESDPHPGVFFCSSASCQATNGGSTAVFTHEPFWGRAHLGEDIYQQTHRAFLLLGRCWDSWVKFTFLGRGEECWTRPEDARRHLPRVNNSLTQTFVGSALWRTQSVL